MKTDAWQFVDQRGEDNLIFQCTCGSDHYVRFGRMGDEDMWGWIDVTAEYRPHGTLWGRIKQAARLIRKGCPWTGNTGLTPSDLHALRDWCDRTITYFEANSSALEPAESRP